MSEILDTDDIDQIGQATQEEVAIEIKQQAERQHKLAQQAEQVEQIERFHHILANDTRRRRSKPLHGRLRSLASPCSVSASAAQHHAIAGASHANVAQIDCSKQAIISFHRVLEEETRPVHVEDVEDFEEVEIPACTCGEPAVLREMIADNPDDQAQLWACGIRNCMFYDVFLGAGVGAPEGWKHDISVANPVEYKDMTMEQFQKSVIAQCSPVPPDVAAQLLGPGYMENAPFCNCYDEDPNCLPVKLNEDAAGDLFWLCG